MSVMAWSKKCSPGTLWDSYLNFRHATQVLISLKLGMRPVMWFKGLLPCKRVYRGLIFFTSLQLLQKQAFLYITAPLLIPL